MQGKIWLFLVFFMASMLSAKEPEVFFSTNTNLAGKYIECVKREDRSIRMVSHRLSDPKVIEVLLQAHKRGVIVEVIVDPKTLTKHSKLRRLAEEGAGVFVWKGKDRMHHTFCLFGEGTIWTGSYTFSLPTRFRHREGAIILSDITMGKKFFEEFSDIKKLETIPFLEYMSAN